MCNISEPREEITPSSRLDAVLAQARLAALVESCEDAIIGKTLDGIITSWNRSAENLFGYTAEESIDRSILFVVPPERHDEERAILERLRGGERVERMETQRRTKDGGLVDVSMTVSPIRDSRGAIVGASTVARDISERRRIEEARDRLMEAERHAREEAQRFNRLKDEFLSTLSHELRTPLSAIQTWGYLLAMGKTKPEEMKQAGEVIVRNATTQKRVIEELLDASRIVGERLQLNLRMVDPAAILQDVLNTAVPAAAAKHIRIVPVIDTTVGSLPADSRRLRQVIWNLLSNALKFTPEHGEVRVTLERDGDRARVTIADSGEGIGSDFLPRIFDRFSQEDASASRVRGGLGLGLSIAQQIADAHGGSIRAYSAGKGHGSTFVVELPMGKPGVADGAFVVSPELALNGLDDRKVDLSGLCVLVVDDEADSRQLLDRILSDSGATVLAAESAESALSIIGKQVPHVLISDIGMPGIDGHELLRRVRGLSIDATTLPAIALTAFARLKDRTDALNAGYMTHLSKPVAPNLVIAAVAAAVNRGPDNGKLRNTDNQQRR